MTAILGGGIAGLSAAYYALENPKIGSLVLFEASERLGGWIRSFESPSGAIFEKGPRTVRPRGPAGKNSLRMIDDLNLTDKLISIRYSHPASKNRMIYVGKKLHTLPNTITSLFKVQSPFERPIIKILWNDFTAPKMVKEDESIYSFTERRLGKDIADYIISPMMCGICAGDAKKISVNFLMESLFESEQKHGSITKGFFKNKLFPTDKVKNKAEGSKFFNRDLGEVGKACSAERSEFEDWSVWGLKGGLELWPKTLAENLSNRNLDISLNSKCENLTFKPDHVEIHINGEIKKFERVISSLSSNSLAKILQRQHPQLSREFEAIPTVTVGVINLQFPKNVLPFEAFGVLVPPSEKLPILGVIFDSCIFPQESSTVLTVMMGGAWFNEYFAQNPTEDYLLEVAVSQVKTMLKINEDPSHVHVEILKDCIPQYVVGHKARLKRIHNYISAHQIPLKLCGSAYQGVGLNDVILSAKNAVQEIV